MDSPLNLIGVGIGPFNLSLAAVLEKAPTIQSMFFERKPHFDWHPEVMFSDSTMQTTYLKDLVTPVDPTSPYSFLNYLVEHQLFYPFIHTQRNVISRKEFENYCSWVSQKLGSKLRFNTEVRSISHSGKLFQVETSEGVYRSENICIATGLIPRIPECARSHIGPNLFHMKSPHLKNLNMTGKSVLIVGGGQTGIEFFRNSLHNQWGRVKDLHVLTRRNGLEPLDESAFTNEYFTPNYVDAFWNLSLEKKSQVVASQKLASDGNTPHYLSALYNDLYRLKYVEKDPRTLKILACRKLVQIEKYSDQYRLKVQNTLTEQEEAFSADIVILCTGFQSAIPQVLEPLFPRIVFDSERRFYFNKSYFIEWDGPEENRIYALNFSRHNHGIVDPQTSLMAWRSAVVTNHIAKRKIYSTEQIAPNFVEFGPANSFQREFP